MVTATMHFHDGAITDLYKSNPLSVLVGLHHIIIGLVLIVGLEAKAIFILPHYVRLFNYCSFQHDRLCKKDIVNKIRCACQQY
jgi:hypothetical protein